ncbi:MAG TPA: hypothetical protein VGD98_22530 [Ktedonobacteraceae bacterium]
MLLQLRSFFRNDRAIRLLIAFLIGLPLGVLAGKFGTNLQNILPFLLFPLLLGAVSAFTVGMRKSHPHLLTLGTGLLAWGGVGVVLLVMTAQATLAPCTTGSCNSTTTRVLSSLLIAYLLLGLGLVTLSSLLTSVLLRRLRRVSY